MSRDRIPSIIGGKTDNRGGSATVRTHAFVFFLLLASTAAFAQNNRSAVSVNGFDTNPCTTTAPCRSFTTALAHTNAGGEVIALDSGGYGAFTITQSVSVIGAPGVHAALTASSGNGVDVSAAAGDSVTIRGLNIILNGSGFVGIVAGGFGTLSIERCNVTGGQFGIWIKGGAMSDAALTETSVRQTGNNGILVQSHAALVNCRVQRAGGAGLIVFDGVNGDGSVSAVNFVCSGNQTGVSVNSFNQGHIVSLTLDRSTIFHNDGDGIYVSAVTGAGAVVRVGASTVNENGQYGFEQATNGVIGTMKDNMLEGNGFAATHGVITDLTAH